MSKGKDEAFEKAYASVVENGWTNVKHMARQVWDLATLSPAHIEDEREAFESWVRRERPGSPLQYVRDALPVDHPRYGEYCDDTLQCAWEGWQAHAALSAPPAAVPAELTNVRCMCGDEYPHDSYGAGFIAGSGMCENCDAAIPAKEPPAAGVPEGGEKVEVVATLVVPKSDELKLKAFSVIGEHTGNVGSLYNAVPLMTVAQHQRIVAALSAPPAAGVAKASVRRVVTDALVSMVSGLTRMSPPPNEPLPDFIQAPIDRAVERVVAELSTTPPASEQQRAVVMPEITGTAIVEVVNGAEGPSLYIGDEDGGYRLAGPKPWGGGKTIHKFTVKLNELVREAMDLAKGEGV
ncbi:hypothetical protein [Metapseudomonas otitidis]|uniref:hypothetical protein n=1 Tax=Metapseudomonas otitidis TaxID=319939 RepID=UPI002446A3A2|nr:hypothetical protein [Pseudomonas otitidis]MDH0335138.1 hypothetical protein [Pseudomonas otitidis]